MDADKAAQVDAAANDEPIDGASLFRNKSMSFKTAMQLSLNNLMTKKARTILTAFAGSIGIIGIALILSVSNGFQHYIDQMENDTLTSYPLTIQSETADMTSMVSAFATAAEDIKKQEGDKVKEQQLMSQMFASVGSNDLKTFNEYVKEKEPTELDGCFDAIQYSFGIQPQIYSTSFKYGVLKVCPNSFVSQYMNSMQQTAMSFSNMDVFSELIDNDEINKETYKVVAGKWPEKYDELVLILQDENTMTDYMSYSLGLRDPDEMNEMVNKLMSGEEVKFDEKPLEWTYDELLELDFALVPASSRYKYNSVYDVWEDMSDDEAYMKSLVKDAERLHISCIAIPNPDNTSGMSGYGIGYLPELTDHIIDVAEQSDIVNHQRAQKKKDVFSGKTFESLKNKENQALGFGDMISIDRNKLAKALGGDSSNALKDDFEDLSDALGNLDPSDYVQQVMTAFGKQAGKAISTALVQCTDAEENVALTAEAMDEAIARNLDTGSHARIVNKMLIGLGKQIDSNIDSYSGNVETVSAMLSGTMAQYMQSEDVVDLVAGYASGLALQQTAKEAPAAVQNLANDMAKSFNVDPAGIASAFSMNMSEEELTRLITSYMSSGSDASYEANLRSLGWADRSNPYSISYYLHDFESKEKFMDFIDSYNDDMEKNGDDDMVISYTDVTGVLLSSVKKITNAVSYVLIAFVAISLIVSSIMIGVITYISVLERTKEIGILRAIGASKKDISRIFNAETVIVGLCAGLIGIVVSLLLLIPINAILIKLTEISALKAILPVAGAIILIIISVLLTLIAGLIPSGMASKKDPVEALRTE